EVVGEAALTQSETSDLGAVIDERKILDLPLNGREFSQLAILVPGVYVPAQDSRLSDRGGFNVAGSRETENNFLLDGVDNNDQGINNLAYRPSIDSIQEFKVQTSMYSAEFGRGSGGQVNVLTKGGTNEFHGTAFEFLRNDNLDARNFFDAKKPEFKRHQFGGTVGGPIVRNRTFFFFSYEGLRLGRGITKIGTVPTPAMRNGDFSELLPSRRITDPQAGQPFPNNIIPTSRFNPVGRGLVDEFPLPNRPGLVGNLLTTRTLTTDLNQFSIRGDHQLSDKHKLFGRFSRLESDDVFPYGQVGDEVNLPGFGRTQNFKNINVVTGLTSLFGPRFVNEFRFGYNRIQNPRVQEGINNDVIQRLNIPFSGRPIDNGVPQVRATGFDPVGDDNPLPIDRTFDSLYFADNATVFAGQHSLRLGGDVKRTLANNSQAVLVRGRFNFTGRFTGQSIADLLLGLPNQSSHGVGNPERNLRMTMTGAYAQDDWKARPNLTLNLGLRYEVNFPITDRDNLWSTFDPETGTMRLAGDGIRRSLYEADLNNFAPRVGLAWSPLKDNRLVIRSGYGIFYNLVTIGNDLLEIGLNYPFLVTEVFNTSTANPLSLSNPYPRGVGTSSVAPSAINLEFRDGYLQKWSLGAQSELAKSLLVEVSYLGSKGSKLSGYRNINQPLPGPESISARRPFPGFDRVRYFDSVFNSWYHSMQVRVEKRYSHGLTFLASYTFGKALDQAPGRASRSAASRELPQDAYNLRAEKGHADFDARHRFVLSSVYELPFARNWTGVAHALFGGWQVSGILTLQTGRPFTPVISRDVANIGEFDQRPDVVGDPNDIDRRTPERWFNTAAYALPQPFTFGNAARNSLFGDAFHNFDFALHKRFRVSERINIQFRAESFNFFNNVNFELPNPTVDSSRFGRIFEALSSREMQFGLKFIF
ncbi:MAG: TonB-dependent receptor, partial [Acidobacteria bacterium]|nr:TonB-dependent receptor [Acidobacteriota bacterium]